MINAKKQIIKKTRAGYISKALKEAEDAIDKEIMDTNVKYLTHEEIFSKIRERLYEQ